MTFSLRWLLLGLLLAATARAAVQPWTQLKVGMPATDVTALLGHPIFSRQGKGFATWTYDDGAEVLIYAGIRVAGWTAPAGAAVPERSRDAWSLRPAGRYYPTMYATLQAVIPVAVTKERKVVPVLPAAATGVGYEQYLAARL